MPAYIVRTIKNLRLVGLFVARDPSDLFGIVDEDMDPGTCEYFKLNNDDGVFFDGQFTAEIEDGLCPDDSDEEPMVCLRPVPGEEAVAPRLSDSLGERLDRKRSWTAFTSKHFQEYFGISPDVSPETIKVVGAMAGVTV
jgi:hypothetical protein